MIKIIFKITRYIIPVLCLSGCFNLNATAWRNKYFAQARSRVEITEKSYDFKSGEYEPGNTYRKSELYNGKGQKISSDSTTFYSYDSLGRIIEEEYCSRDCNDPAKTKYYYDNDNRLIKVVDFYDSEKTERINKRYYYDSKNLLEKIIFGEDSLNNSEIYSYDSKSRNICKVTKQYYENTKDWLVHVDSIFYDNNDKVFLNKRYEVGKELLKITKYTYKDSLILTETDTTITSIGNSLITPNTVHSAYFNRTEYKYNSDGKIIEKVIFQPDYKTPHQKITYEYSYTLLGADTK